MTARVSAPTSPSTACPSGKSGSHETREEGIAIVKDDLTEGSLGLRH